MSTLIGAPVAHPGRRSRPTRPLPRRAPTPEASR
jgi:hypothetical protein